MFLTEISDEDGNHYYRRSFIRLHVKDTSAVAYVEEVSSNHFHVRYLQEGQLTDSIFSIQRPTIADVTLPLLGYFVFEGKVFYASRIPKRDRVKGLSEHTGSGWNVLVKPSAALVYSHGATQAAPSLMQTIAACESRTFPIVGKQFSIDDPHTLRVLPPFGEELVYVKEIYVPVVGCNWKAAA